MLTLFAEAVRLRAIIHGAVQGVGFRPFVYRLAAELRLTGWVNNSAQGVVIEVEGDKEALDIFLSRLEPEKPPRAFIQSLETTFLDPAGYRTFEIHPSDDDGPKTALILPDSATCADCQREIFDPANRRYRYPFTNCTHCGPRFSIIESLPYDRPNTTLKNFVMCADCRAEYENPLDRRFHAQPNACPVCGPQLEFWSAEGQAIAARHEALLLAVDSIKQGKIVAVKGLGGFHLIVDARDEAAVRRLRRRKGRAEKPFALMFPSFDAVQSSCHVSLLEARLLRSPEAPIVLLRRWTVAEADSLAPSIAPGNPYLGVMLPYTPLHHLLLAELGFPIVATSGNISDEPLCTDEHEALERLPEIADLFLVHNRPIARHVDDSVVRVAAGRELVLRRARGYAPLPVTLPEPIPPTLAVGAHLKNTVALAVGREAFVSQHIGDLETVAAYTAFRHVIRDFETLYASAPTQIVCDAHPDYVSTHYAERRGLPLTYVQHHFAHVLACLAENDLHEPVLGIAWDGTGYGLDGAIWGGEFLHVADRGFTRVAHLRNFRLPGGDKAIREPRRAALGVLYEIFGDAAFEMTDLPPLQACSPSELKLFAQMLPKGINAPFTSSMGRLFDAVSALIGLRQVAGFEGQAAMELEFALSEDECGAYPILIRAEQPTSVLDWELLVRGVIADVRAGTSSSVIAAKFHNSLVEAILAIAHQIGEPRVVLSGGCFQNKYLLEQAVSRLTEAGFRPYWPQRLPPNDGGIALGQIMAAQFSN